MCVILLLLLLLLLNCIIIHSLSNINCICSEIVINDIMCQISNVHWAACNMSTRPYVLVICRNSERLRNTATSIVCWQGDTKETGIRARSEHPGYCWFYIQWCFMYYGSVNNDVNKPCTQWYIHADKEVGLKKDIHEHFGRTSRLFRSLI